MPHNAETEGDWSRSKTENDRFFGLNGKKVKNEFAFSGVVTTILCYRHTTYGHSSQVHRKKTASNHFPSAFSSSLAYHFGSLLNRDRQPLANSWSSYMRYASAEVGILRRQNYVKISTTRKSIVFFFASSNHKMFNRNVTVKLCMLRLHV